MYAYSKNVLREDKKKYDKIIRNNLSGRQLAIFFKNNNIYHKTLEEFKKDIEKRQEKLNLLECDAFNECKMLCDARGKSITNCSDLNNLVNKSERRKLNNRCEDYNIFKQSNLEEEVASNHRQQDFIKRYQQQQSSNLEGTNQQLLQRLLQQQQQIQNMQFQQRPQQQQQQQQRQQRQPIQYSQRLNRDQQQTNQEQQFFSDNNLKTIASHLHDLSGSSNKGSIYNKDKINDKINKRNKQETISLIWAMKEVLEQI